MEMTGHAEGTAREILEGEGGGFFGGVWDDQRRARRLGNVDCVRSAGRGRGGFPEGGRSEKLREWRRNVRWKLDGRATWD